MSKTFKDRRDGSSTLLMLSRIDSEHRRRTSAYYARQIDFEKAEHSKEVAVDVTRDFNGGPRYVVTVPPFKHSAPGFGRRKGDS